MAVDRATDTIYVATGNNADGPTAPGGDTVSVIDGRHCQASGRLALQGAVADGEGRELSRAAVTVDQATDTVYVTNFGDNTVSVINGATCNSLVSSGCGQTPATVPVGAVPAGIFADHANHTVYVTNPAEHDTVSMIDSATCNGSHLAGCPSQPPPTVAVGGGPGDVDVNEVTHSVYVTILTGLSAVRREHLQRHGPIGLRRRGPGGRARIGTAACINIIPSCGGYSTKVDPGNNTIYEADGTTTVTVFDGRTCQASDLAGCATQTPGTVTVAPASGLRGRNLAGRRRRRCTLCMSSTRKTTTSRRSTPMSATARHLSALRAAAAADHPHRRGPRIGRPHPDTQTLYTANQVTNDVSVIDARVATPTITSGCRQPPPAITLPGPGALAADPAVGTVYVATGTNTVSMINSQTCNAYRHDGCTPTPPTVTVGAFPAWIAVDQHTHTVYVANAGSGTTGSVSVFDARTCNATTTSGCENVRTLQVPGGNAQA